MERERQSFAVVYVWQNPQIFFSVLYCLYFLLSTTEKLQQIDSFTAPQSQNTLEPKAQCLPNFRIICNNSLIWTSTFQGDYRGKKKEQNKSSQLWQNIEAAPFFCCARGNWRSDVLSRLHRGHSGMERHCPSPAEHEGEGYWHQAPAKWRAQSCLHCPGWEIFQGHL